MKRNGNGPEYGRKVYSSFRLEFPRTHHVCWVVGPDEGRRSRVTVHPVFHREGGVPTLVGFSEKSQFYPSAIVTSGF